MHICLLVIMSGLFSSSAAAGRIVRDRATKTITIHPQSTVDSLVILTHGLGDSAEGFADVAQMFSAKLPTTKFVLPTAPNQPVTLNGGMRMPSWYDITGLSDRANEKCEGIEESSKIIQDIMDANNAEGIPYNKMLLAGFSQGGALSLFTGLQLPKEKKLSGIFVMSGYLAGAKAFKLTPGLESTPVLHCHGKIDPMVQFSWAEQTRDAVVGMGVSNYVLKEYPTMEHSVCPDELEVGLRFIASSFEGASLADKPVDEMSIKELKMAISHAGLGDKAVGLLEKQDFVNLLKEKREL